MADRRVQKTNQAIYQALQTISEQTPLSQITVSAIAREANITRKTFYNHYPTVLDAYQAMLDSVVDEVATKTNQDWEAVMQTDSKHTPSEETEIRLMLFLGNVREIIENHAQNSRRRNRRITQDEQIAFLLTPFTRCVESGLLGNPDRFGKETGLVAEFVLAGMLWMYRRWLSSDDAGSFYAAQQRVCKLIMNGLNGFEQNDRDGAVLGPS